MRNKSMFSLDIVNTDQFTDMPSSTQALYFHLGMNADDDGFQASPKGVLKMLNSSAGDLEILVAKGYLIPVGNGVIVVKQEMERDFSETGGAACQIVNDIIT